MLSGGQDIQPNLGQRQRLSEHVEGSGFMVSESMWVEGSGFTVTYLPV